MSNRTMEKPADNNPNAQQQEYEQRLRHLQRPNEEADLHQYHILRREQHNKCNKSYDE